MQSNKTDLIQPENDECAILIASCGAYTDAWDPFFTLFKRYWPDCPFPVYVVTDKGRAPEPAQTIVLDKDHGWADNVKIALDRINRPYVIYILDDVPLRRKVDTKRILHVLEIMKKEQAGYVRLYPSPGPDSSFKSYAEVGLIAPSAPYRTSTMAAIWDVRTFKKLLLSGENAWQMEIIGTERSRALPEPFLSVYPHDGPAIDHFATAIKKGMWQWDAIRFFRKEGVIIDTSKRRVESFGHYLVREAEHIPLLCGVIRRVRHALYGKGKSVLTSQKP
jgi:hypothetical protein